MNADTTALQTEFRQLFDTYSKLVYSVAFSYMKNQSDSNDIMQEVFLKLFQNLPQLEKSNLKAWLITVTANNCKNVLRSAWFSRTFSLDDADEPSCEQDFGEGSDLFHAVMKLPEKDRIPIHLYYYEGYSTSEIAKILKIKESTVRVRLMRTREKLKHLLEEETV